MLINNDIIWRENTTLTLYYDFMIQHSSVKSVKITMTARKAMIAKTKNAYGEVSLYSYHCNKKVANSYVITAFSDLLLVLTFLEYYFWNSIYCRQSSKPKARRCRTHREYWTSIESIPTRNSDGRLFYPQWIFDYSR